MDDTSLDVASIGRLDQRDWKAHWFASPPIRELGSLELRAQIPAGPDEGCYVASLREISQWPFFLRKLPQHRTGPAFRAALERRSRIEAHGVESMLELTSDPGPYAASKLLDGVSIRDLGEVLQAPLAWPVAIAVAHDACLRLHQLRELTDLEITPARIRLTVDGVVHVCIMMPAPAPRPWERELVRTLHACLALAATAAERELLDELLDDGDPAALEVACDALLARHAELDPLLPAVVTAHTSAAPRLAREALRPRIGRTGVLGLWQLVTDTVENQRARRWNRPRR